MALDKRSGTRVMIIISDNLAFAKKILPDLHFAQCSHAKQFHYPLNELISFTLGSLTPLYIAEKNDNFWSTFILCKHSPQSQFDQLKHFLSQHEPEHATGLIAESGENFHGFKNRPWSAKKGNIHFTVFLKPDFKLQHFGTEFLALSAVSVAKTLNSFQDLQDKAQIKWVNDVLIKEAKIAGVITHMSTLNNQIQCALLGIGINVESPVEISPNPFVSKTTHLQFHLKPHKNLLSKTFSILLDELKYHYQALSNNNYEEIRNNYKSLCVALNQSVSLYENTPESSCEKLIAEGLLTNIGPQLEIFLNNQSKAFRSGRLIIN